MRTYLGTGDGYSMYTGEVAGSGNGFGDTFEGLSNGDGAQGDDGYEDGNGCGDWTIDTPPKTGDGP